MENFSTIISLDNYQLWAKNVCYRPPTHDCASTCTSLSRSSEISRSFFNMEREDDEQSQFSHFHPNSPANTEDLDDYLPEESVYANDGSFDERFQDNFTDLMQNYDDTGLQCEEEGQQQEQDPVETEEERFNTGNRMWDRTGQSSSKHGKLLFEAWKMIRKLFLKYLGSQEAVKIIKDEMQNVEMLAASGMKDIYKMLKRQAKKISRGDIINYMYSNRASDDYMAITNGLFQKLFVDFLHEKAAYAVSGISNVSKNLKKMMLDILSSTSRSLNISRG